ncbi:glycosyltransferase family 39 protein [Azoarcus sp. L1K30]|uniref:ArnT family glycosyltransferase n=1 Tax=Azoarcus sp. L1K30 TaxID=2820277 RepID=UPI001B80F301|nr:glycosyltransferase family 39 protein [Azoarcus sp. L1K30]MBR0566808.1 glycosyltransferase family 39 protein [Azoarcus sp. L1K30]
MNPDRSAAPRPHSCSLALFLAITLAVSLYRIGLVVHLHLDPYVDEAYYWGWAQALDWGYYSKPPMIAALIAASTTLFGDSLLALKAPSLLLYPATALVIRQLGCELFNARVGFWSGLAFLTLPITSTLGLFASTDAPLLFCWALGMLLLWRALPAGRLSQWIGIGVVCGLGLMSKYTMLAFIGSAFLILLADPDGRRQLLRPGPWVGLLVAGAILAPNLWWNWQHDFPTIRHTAEITRVGVGARSVDVEEFGEFIGAQWLSFGPLLLPILLWAMLRLRPTWTEPRFRFLLGFALPLLFIVGLQALTGRANGNWSAPVFVAASILSIAYLARQAHWKLMTAAVTFNVSIGLAVYHWPDIAQLTGTPLSARTDPYKRARGWSELSAAVRPYMLAHPQALLLGDDRELLAQLIYALRPPHHARWQADPHVVDHYGLTAAFGPESGDPVLFVSTRREVDDVVSRFDDAERIATIDVAVHKDFHRKVSIWLLKGFKGY